MWLALTVSFEFLGGHFLFGQPWQRLLADYDLLDGRVWVLVLVVTALAPRLAFGVTSDAGVTRVREIPRALWTCSRPRSRCRPPSGRYHGFVGSRALASGLPSTWCHAEEQSWVTVR